MPERGCGSRKEGGLYLEVETSKHGIPVEYFMLDPAIEWKGKVPLRAPMLVDGSEGEVKHVVLGVGKNHYPTVPDFVEEGRAQGFSKRIPRNFDLTALTAGKSRLVLMHPRAIPYYPHYCHTECNELNKAEHECVFDLWSLSMLHPSSDQHEIVRDGHGPLFIRLPCGSSYRATLPATPTQQEFIEGEYVNMYTPGLFISLPIHKITYINKKDNTVPGEIKQQIEESGFKLEIAKE